MLPIPIPGFTDPFSALTHLLAALVFFILTFVLWHRGRGAGGRVTFLLIFSFAVVFQFSMSGVYHLLDVGDGRSVLQRLDHAAIFTLIAASFTTVHGILFRGVWRWGVLIFVWVVAINGIAFKTIFFNDVPEWLGLTLFLFLGWIGLTTAFLLCRRFGCAYNKYLLFSGCAYTAGAVVEFIRAPNLIPGVVGPHELFHIGVIVGVSFHWAYTYKFANGKLPELPKLRAN